MNKLKIGVIGAGKRTLSLLRILRETTFFEIVKVYDPLEENLNEFIENFGKNIIVSDNFLDVINDEKVNLIFIGSINSCHAEQIQRAIESKKNIFAEKPIAVSIDECKLIKDAYLKNPVKILISYPLRHSPIYKRVKKIIDEGKVGKIISMEFNEVLDFNHGCFIMSDWRRFEKYSGGHILEKCCHDIDLVNWITNSVPIRVASFGGLDFFNKDNNELKEFIRWPNVVINPFLSEKDIVDNQVVIIEYHNGVRATFHTNLNSSIPERRMYICGSKGTIQANVLTGEVKVRCIGKEEDYINIKDEVNKGGHGGGDFFLMNLLKKLGESDSQVDDYIDDGIKSVISALMIEKARKENKVVDLTETWRDFNYI